ncbi:hypothetical protein IWQ62_003144 [Dispira parvispora]|uniref:Uncharacterized protein n=1 Tax=Dispira parvispora TaxID=1520584 RepID=A0A9W8E6T6_9FUNG|nr:hypothetical protein IWQ62_003144 [Dispira parvispora]
MKVFLAYALLQAILPTYLAYTHTPSEMNALGTLHRRNYSVESTPQHRSAGQLYRRSTLEKRSPQNDGNARAGSSEDGVRSSDTSSPENAPRVPLHRRAYLQRRGDYSIQQSRQSLNQLNRRSPVSLMGITDTAKASHREFDY